MRRSFLSTFGLVAIAGYLAATAAEAGAPAGGFCCRPSRSIRLVPTEAGVVAGMVYGTAEIDECLGLSFLRVVAVGRVPDQTLVIPVLPSAIQPTIGDWITMNVVGRQGIAKGEGVLPEITAAFVAGRELDVTDSNFEPLLVGQF